MLFPVCWGEQSARTYCLAETLSDGQHGKGRGRGASLNTLPVCCFYLTHICKWSTNNSSRNLVMSVQQVCSFLYKEFVVRKAELSKSICAFLTVEVSAVILQINWFINLFFQCQTLKNKTFFSGGKTQALAFGSWGEMNQENRWVGYHTYKWHAVYISF